MAWIALDVVPEVGRSDPVTQALAEAVELRDRHRQASEELARAQAELEQAQKADVDATAAKIRAGTQPGAISANVTKAKQAVELAKRNEDAIAVASEAAHSDLALAMQESSSAWIASLDDEATRARQRASDSLAAYEAALDELGSAACAGLWVRGAVADGRWDRPQRQALDGRVARSSGRVSVNAEPFGAKQIVAWAHELVEPPSTSTPPPMSTSDTIVTTYRGLASTASCRRGQSSSPVRPYLRVCRMGADHRGSQPRLGTVRKISLAGASLNRHLIVQQQARQRLAPLPRHMGARRDVDPKRRGRVHKRLAERVCRLDGDHQVEGQRRCRTRSGSDRAVQHDHDLGLAARTR
jgi:hypothetical protein